MQTIVRPPLPLEIPEHDQIWSPDKSPATRSTLYHLTPIGIGTPLVESLSSYIGRLADAHAVPIVALIKHVLFPHMRIHHTVYKLIEHAHLSLGTTPTAQAWVTTVEQQTGRRGLESLTLLPWASLIHSMELLHKTQRWCSYCYRDWQGSGQPLYNPLLWSIPTVTTCPQHQRNLQHQCPNPHCKKTIPLLSPRYRVGHCAYCCQWLGAEESGITHTVSSHPPCDHAQQSWITNAIGEMLSERFGAPGTTPHELFQSTLHSCLVIHARGKACRLAQMLGLPEQSIFNWRRPHSSISLKQLLNLSYHFNVSPVQFLRSTHEQIASFQLHLPTLRGNIFPKNSSRPSLSQDPEKQRIARCLLKDTTADPPLTLREISLQLGVPTTTLSACFPQESRDARKRYTEWRRRQTSSHALNLRRLIRNEILLMRKQGLIPKPHLAAKNLGMPFSRLWPAFQTAWEEATQES